MDFFDINYDDRSSDLTPPKKRLPKMLAWIRSLIAPFQYLRDRLYGDYRKGSIDPIYSAIGVYDRGDRVIFEGDKAVWECMGNTVTSGAGGPPSDPTNWRLVQDIFIGTNERVKYTSQFITLEYALNHYYMIPTSDPQIYLENNDQGDQYFTVGQTNTGTPVSNSFSFATGAVGNVPVIAPAPPNFTVNVPNAVLATLGATLTDQKNNVTQFVNQYKLAGMTFDVVGY